MLPTIDKTPDYLNLAEIAVALDLPPNEVALRRKIGALPQPVALQSRTIAGRRRHLWSKATIETFKASGLKLVAAVE